MVNYWRNKYIDLITNNEALSKNTIRAFVILWKRVVVLEDKIGKTLEEGYKAEDYVKLLSGLNAITDRTFRNYKSRIANYIKYLVYEGALNTRYLNEIYNVSLEDVQSDTALRKKYFKNFDQLKKAIDLALEEAARVDSDVFAMHIAVAYLSWVGVKPDEMCDIKKSDVHDDYIIVGDREVRPNEMMMEHIVEYRDANGFYTSGRGVIFLKYAKSVYLLRTSRKAHLTPKDLSVHMRIFSRGDGDSNSSLSCGKIYTSGIYSRAYMYETINGTIQPGEKDKIEKVLGGSYSSVGEANRMLREYQAYRECFHSETQNKT